MNTSSSTTEHPAKDFAVVFGGGGSTGNAWLIGVAAGLADSDLDLRGADLSVGTSAGATAAAQLAGADPAELYEASLQPVGPARGGRRPVGDHLARLRSIIDSCETPAAFHRAMGTAALALPGAQEREFSERWRDIVASRFPGARWPDARLIRLAAVDAESGTPVVFDNSSGVDLVDAVAASCSSALPYWLGDRPYIDGGYRRNENADLASGYSRVLVLSPLGGAILHPAHWQTSLDSQLRELRDSGSLVQVILPDGQAKPYMGANAMDLSLRPAAARAGYLQGQHAARRLAVDFG